MLGALTTTLPKAGCFFKKSQFEDATKEFELALEKAQLTEDKVFQASCLDSLGIAYRIANDFERAEAAAVDALQAFKGLPNTEHYQAVCYNNLGSLYKDLEAFGKAKEVYQAGLELALKMENYRMAYNLLNNLAAIAIMTHDYKEGLKHAQQAYEGFKKLNHKHGEVHALVFVGHCCFSTGSYARALEHYLGSLKLLKAVDHKLIEAQAYKGLGNVYAKMLAYLEALANYQKAVEITMAARDFEEAVEINLAIAAMYKEHGNIDAKKFIYRTLTLAIDNKLEKHAARAKQSLRDWRVG